MLLAKPDGLCEYHKLYIKMLGRGDSILFALVQGTDIISPNSLLVGRINTRTSSGPFRLPTGPGNLMERVDKLYKAWLDVFNGQRSFCGWRCLFLPAVPAVPGTSAQCSLSWSPVYLPPCWRCCARTFTTFGGIVLVSFCLFSTWGSSSTLSYPYQCPSLEGQSPKQLTNKQHAWFLWT